MVSSRSFLTSVIILVILAGLVVPAAAGAVGGPAGAAGRQSQNGAASAPPAAASAQAGPRLEIRLQRATFDPLVESPLLPAGLTLTAYPGDGSGYYLVQFAGPIVPAWRAQLEGVGAVIADYVPEFAYVVRLDGAAASRVRALEAVRWVGIYQPAYRLSTALDALLARAGSGETARLVVRSFAGEPADLLAGQLRALGAVLQDMGRDSGGGTIFKLEIPAAAIPAVARLGGVAWVEPWSQPVLTNAVARSALSLNKDAVEAEVGLYGAGQVVVVGDTGVSTGNQATMHPDFRGHFYQGTWGSGTCGSWADYYAHGTHVAGSVLGSGVMDGAVTSTHSYSGTNAGIAPEALLWAWAFCSNWSGLPETDPYNGYYGLMYADGPNVRISTNSWGYTTGQGEYGTFARETDRFIWDHQDMVVVFSAGNSGEDGNSDGIVDLDSLNMPAGAKNIITVGASENYRMSGGYNPGGPCSTWGTCWPSDFPANPVRDDRLSDDPSGMVAFSGRGPVHDGRLKPDLLAPGSNVVSCRHDAGSADPFWGVYNAYYSYCGGTSMSAPLAAGSSAIVREFYTVTYGIDPTAALVKATLINGAYDMTPGQYRDEVPDGSKDDVIRRPDLNQGWGRIDLYNTLVHDLPYALWFYEDHTGLSTGDAYSATLTVSGDDHPFRVTLAWSDYPGTEATDGALVNDLDLQVVAPGGTTYYGNDVLGDGLPDGDVDRTNNVEGVDFNPQPGNYTVYVYAYNIPQAPQPFALVASGDMGWVGYLDGTVHDGTLGGGLEGAAVRAITGTVQARTTTDATGYYTMPLAVDTYTVAAWKYGYSMQTVPGVVIVSGTVYTQDFTLTQTPLYSLTGCITDSVTGDPLAAEVSVRGPFGDLIVETSAPQATGCYSLSLYGGPYTVRAEARLHQPGQAFVNLVGDAVQNFALVATTTDGILWGKVTSQATGDPLEGATIQVTPGLTSTQSAANGSYEILLPHGTYTVSVSAPLYSTVVETDVVVPQSNLVERNYALPTAHMALLPPGGIGATLFQGEQVTRTLVISNSGQGGLDFETSERDQGFTPLLSAPLAGEDVLIVNRGSTSAVTAIKAALDALGHTYLEVNEATFQGMSLDDLLAYDLLIWAGTTGSFGSGDNANETHLMAYLDAGGPILHIDNDLGYYRHGSTYYDTYLHAVYGLDDATDTDTSPQLIDGLDIMAPLVVDLTTEPFPDGVVPRDAAATPLFEAQGPTNPNYPYVGLRVEGGAYQAVYLAFDFNYVGGAETQREVIGRAYDWLVAADIPWLSTDPVSGTVPGGEMLSVTLSFDASVVTETGTYRGLLRFETNDPTAQPRVDYPVTMTVVPPLPVFAIEKAASAEAVEVGLPLTYTVTVSNAGGPATGVVISDTLPGNTWFAWADGGGALVDGAVVWSGLAVPAGGMVQVAYGVTITCVPSGTEVVNDGYLVTAFEWPTPTYGVPVTVTAVAEGITGGFSFPTPVLRNQPVAFTSWSENATAYEWSFGDGGSSYDANPTHTYTGATGDYTVAFTASNACSFAAVRHLLTLHDYAVAVTPTAAMRIGDPGDTVTYTLRFTNAGTLPDLLGLNAASSAWPAQLSTDTLPLDAGEGAPVVVSVTVPAGAYGGAERSVMIAGRSLSDPRLPAASASALLTTRAGNVYRVALGPAAAGQVGLAGQTVTYTLRVTNTGNVVDTIYLTRTVPGWRTSFSVSGLTISRGGWRTVEVYVAVPLTAVAGLTDTAVIRAAGSGEYAEAMLVTQAAVAWYRVYLPLVFKGTP